MLDAPADRDDRSRNYALSERVAQFIVAEMALLDDRKFEDWIALFEEDGYYWAPIAPDQKDPLAHVSLFYDTVSTMRTRTARLRHPKIFMQTPHARTVHITGNVEAVRGDGGGIVTARCNFIMLEYRPTRPQHVWGGRYEYRLREDEQGSLRISNKKATLVNSDDQFPSLALWF